MKTKTRVKKQIPGRKKKAHLASQKSGTATFNPEDEMVEEEYLYDPAEANYVKEKKIDDDTLEIDEEYAGL